MRKAGKRIWISVGFCVVVLTAGVLAHLRFAGDADSPGAESPGVRLRSAPRSAGRVARRLPATKVIERTTDSQKGVVPDEADVARFRKQMQTLRERRQEMPVRIAALKEIQGLPVGQQVACIRELFSSDSQDDRAIALQGVRILFSQEARKRNSGTSYRDLLDKFGSQPSKRTEVRALGGGDTAEITLEDGLLVNTPTTSVPVACKDEMSARETAEINTIVKLGMVDDSPEVWKEALQTAGTLDITTCNAVYQYAMSAGSDEVRLAVLEEAKNGDDAFRLCLEFSALDVAGEQVKQVVSADIRKVTGQNFNTTEEAFMWYEKNQANNQVRAVQSTQ